MSEQFSVKAQSEELTLYVDLLDTHLEDFQVLLNIRKLALRGLRERVEGDWTQPPRWQEMAKAMSTETNAKFDNWLFRAKDKIVHLGISSQQEGATYCTWNVYYHSQGYGLPLEQESGKREFRLEITHYRHNRLNVTLWEWPSEPMLGPFLMGWLERRWRDGVVNLLEEGYRPPPPEGHDETMTYEARIRAVMYTDTAEARWRAVLPIYEEWRNAKPGEATHQKLAKIIGVHESHIKRVWIKYKRDKSQNENDTYDTK